MQTELLFIILTLLIPIGIFWNVYQEYIKMKNENKQLSEEIEKIKQMLDNRSSDDNKK